MPTIPPSSEEITMNRLLVFFFPEVIFYVFANIERYIFKSKIRVYLEKSF